MKAICRYKPSGDLFGKDFNPKMLDYDQYWNRETQAKLADFEPVPEEDYRKKLEALGFVYQQTQRRLFE